MWLRGDQLLLRLIDPLLLLRLGYSKLLLGLIYPLLLLQVGLVPSLVDLLLLLLWLLLLMMGLQISVHIVCLLDKHRDWSLG